MSLASPWLACGRPFLSPGTAPGRYWREVILLLSACVAPTEPPEGPEEFRIDPQPHLGVTAYLEQQIADEELVGLVAAVTEGSTVVYLEGFGWADQEAQVPMEPEKSVIRWASLSKGVAGWLAVKLAEEGLLDLNASLPDLIGGYRVPDSVQGPDCRSLDCVEPIDADIQLEQLLNHTSGILHYDNGIENPSPSNDEANDPAINSGIAWATDRFVDLPLVASPGSAFNYSTFGYNLAGVALEQVADQSFADLAADRLAPIGFETLQPDYGWVETDNAVAGYHRSDGEVTSTNLHDVSWKLPGGGFQSTVVDLARWCVALQQGTGLEEASRERLLTPTFEGSTYALGFHVVDLEAGRLVTHGGSQPGAQTAIWLNEADGRCFLVMSNTRWAEPSVLAAGMAAKW